MTDLHSLIVGYLTGAKTHSKHLRGVLLMDTIEKIIHIGIIVLLIAALGSGALMTREPKGINDLMAYIETNKMNLPNINVDAARPASTGVEALDNLGNIIFSLFSGVANIAITIGYGVVVVIWAIGFILT